MDRLNRSFDSAMDKVGDVDLGMGWQQKILVFGGVIGAVVGLISAYFYIRAAEESNLDGDTPQAPEAGDAVKLGLSLLTIVRTITEWGQRK